MDVSIVYSSAESVADVLWRAKNSYKAHAQNNNTSALTTITITSRHDITREAYTGTSTLHSAIPTCTRSLNIIAAI